MLRSRMGRLLLALLPLIVSSVGICEDATTTVPKEIGGLPYKNSKKFEEEALGIGLTYQGDGATLTVYLYRGGIPEIPAGIKSDIFASQFAQAQSDVGKPEKWTEVKLVSDTPVMLGSRNLKVRRAVYEALAAETPVTSILYMTAARNHFYKARLTAPSGTPVLGEERLASIERNLGELITGWILHR